MKNYITIDPKEIEEANSKHVDSIQKDHCFWDSFESGANFALSKSNETLSPILERALKNLEIAQANIKAYRNALGYGNNGFSQLDESINEIKALQK